MHRGLAISVTGVIAIIALACGPGTPQQSPAASPDGLGSPGAQETSVEIFDFGFRPSSATVAVGGTVRWTNTGAVAHTVTFSDGPDSGNLAAGGDFDNTFSAAGTFNYHCSIHATMTGSVTVGP